MSRIIQQPIAVIVGSLVEPKAIYVVVGNRVYKTESTLKAVDIAFQICFALDYHYLANDHSLWTFIQKACYSIDIKSDKVSCSLNALLGEIQVVIDSL